MVFLVALSILIIYVLVSLVGTYIYSKEILKDERITYGEKDINKKLEKEKLKLEKKRAKLEYKLRKKQKKL